MKNKLLFLLLTQGFLLKSMELSRSHSSEKEEAEVIIALAKTKKKESELSKIFNNENSKLFKAIIGSENETVKDYLKSNQNIDLDTLKNAETLALKISSTKSKKAHPSYSWLPCWNLSSDQKSALYNMVGYATIFSMNLAATQDVDDGLKIPALLLPVIPFFYNSYLLFSNHHAWNESNKAHKIVEVLYDFIEKSQKNDVIEE